jgi:hypothetical protein
MSSLPLSTQPQRISDIMRLLMDKAAHEECISVGSILHLFGVRGFAFLLLMLALLNIVSFMVPFVSVLFGLPMVILAAQMVLGFHAPIFPAFIRRRTIQRQALMQGLARALYGVEKIEHYIKPRFMFLTHPALTRLHGLLALMLAVMVTLPIPLFNVPPSVGLALLAIGMLQRDGIFIVLAYVIGFGCLALFKSLGQMAHSMTHSAPTT